MKLSALDLIAKYEGTTTAQNFAETLELAKALDSIGYHRYWFAEHHGSKSYSSSAPEVAAAVIAGATKQIHVGTGGSMIMHYSPLKIAEQFKTLSAFAPGRVDFGIGRAPGGDQSAIAALAQGRYTEFTDLYDKIQTILAYLSDQVPVENLYNSLVASPVDLPVLPEAFLLGSSGQSATEAGKLGIAYSFATFFGVAQDPEIFRLYRENFKISAFHETPYVKTTYQVVAADSQEEADYLAKPIEIARVNQRRGYFNAMVPPEVAKDYEFTMQEQAVLDFQYEHRILVKGDKQAVADILEQEKNRYQFDEIMVYSPIYGIDKRIHSYKLLFDALS